MLFFGSLRKNSKRGYNFNRCGKQTYIETITLDGFDMYSLGPYPAICKGDGKIVCELHSVDERTFLSISGMERGAGYTEEVLKVGDIDASIWMMPADRLKKSGKPKVENGDWD